MFGGAAVSSMSELSSHRFRLLRVLDLEGEPVEKFSDAILDLTCLRYLSLRRTKISKIPRSIGRLVHLETLDLKHTFVTEVPADILKLRNLRHLLAYRYRKKSHDPFNSTYGFRAPSGLGCLTSLQKLCFIEADQSTGVWSELEKLSQLRRLGITKLRTEDGRSLCSSIQKMPNLRSLDVSSASEKEILDMQAMTSPPRHLQRLWLQGPLEELPRWISSLHSLIKIRLRWSQLSCDPLEPLQDLPHLVELQLRRAFDGYELMFKAGGFAALRVLHLHDLLNLKRISIEAGAMSNIEKMVITGCESLEEVPLGIKNLSMKSLSFSNMQNQLIRELQTKEGDNYANIAHISNICCTQMHEGRWRNISLTREVSLSS